MLERKKTKMRCFSRISISTLFAMLLVFCLTQPVFASGRISVSYYYEEVCASCDGTKDFFELYNRVISAEDKTQFQAEIATYNVFMDSCKVRYEEVKKDLQIPSGTSLPVLIVGDTWISGHDNMEAQMRKVLLSAEPEEEAATAAIKNKEKDRSETSDAEVGRNENPLFWSELKKKTEDAKLPVVLLFSTNNCDDCSAVKQWFAKQDLPLEVLEYNIVEQECINELKAVFSQYQVPEERQKVPAVFIGNRYYIGRDEIPALTGAEVEISADNKALLDMIEKIEEERYRDAGESDEMNLLTLAAAGLLAGFNPCSISMLLMLLSLLLSEKASIWKSGILYLTGKYAAYISIGLVIFVTASQISNQTMETIGNVMNLVMGVLFAVAAVFYIADAIRVYRQDYGNIKTQLPVSLRRMNHNLIKKVSSAGGVMQPLMILILGIVISFGEFFCTGQIYMASITYMLKDQMKTAVLPFLVYTTAMSIPAVIMILLIQRTRNTDAVSDFMFRHLGVIKIFNAVLFMIFAVYFLVF